MKRVLLSILFLSVFLTSCRVNNEAGIIKRLEKTLDSCKGYETEAEVKITMDEKESNYKLREIYIDDDEIRLEILEPKENNGVIIEYRDDKIFLNNTSIDQSISLNSIKGLNKGLLFGEIFTNRESIKSIEEEKIDDESYYMIKYRPRDENKYNKEKILYLNKKDFKPYKMITRDEENNQRVVIKYNNFKYNKD